MFQIENYDQIPN